MSVAASERVPSRGTGFALKSALMVDGDKRYCDVCEALLPRGVPFRLGYTTPAAVEASFADATPAARTTFTTTPEGLVRFEVCAACAAAIEPALLPHEATDPLH